MKNYSLGMKQHLLLAMAVVNEPKLLILDEPLNGLDPTSAIHVRELLLELFEQGTTILLSSHNLAEIDRVTSKILFLKSGLLIQEDMSAYEQIRYAFVVEDVEKAENALMAAAIAVETVGDNLQIYSDRASLASVLTVFEQQEIVVLDMEKKVLGSEDRYRTIFGEKSGSR